MYTTRMFGFLMNSLTINSFSHKKGDMFKIDTKNYNLKNNLNLTCSLLYSPSTAHNLIKHA